MNRPLTALFAALEALLVVGIGVGLPLVPLTFMWAFQYGLQIDWSVFWRGAVDFWLIGHGVDIRFTIDPVTAASFGFADAGATFVVSIAALGIGLVTLLLAVRTGRRIAETPYVKLGSLVAVLVAGLLSVFVTFSALNSFARPSLWLGAILPTLVFAVGLGIGVWLTERRLSRMSGDRPARDNPLAKWWAGLPVQHRGVVSQSLRGGTAAAVAVILFSSLILTGMILTNYAQVISLYEGIHSGVLGGITLTLAELAFLPNFVVWTVAWLIGPGFAIGAGSSVGPLGTSLGPLPAVPILGALPTGDLAFGFLGLLVPIVAAFLVGVAIRPAVLRSITRTQPDGVPAEANERSILVALVLTGVGVGVAGGLILGVLAWISGGAAGPGRLAQVGPDALLVALFAALEFGIAATVGLLVSRGSRAT